MPKFNGQVLKKGKGQKHRGREGMYTSESLEGQALPRRSPEAKTAWMDLPRAYTGTNCANTLTLDFQPSQLWDHRLCCLKLPSL